MTRDRRTSAQIRRTLGRLFIALSAALAAIPAAGAAASPRVSAAAGSAFVSREGTQLMRMGQPWNFAGYNLSCQQPFTMSAAALQYYLEEIVSTLPAGSSGAVVRMWWFQSDMGTGSNPWAPFDQVLAAAKAAGVTIIPTLTNQWQTCDEPTPTTSEKLLPWYQDGYEQPEGGYSLSYKAFALDMATHFADDPTIAFWQLVNEAEAPTSTGCQEAAAATALRTFGDDMAVSMHQVDPNHLVNLGTQGSGECGTAGTDYSYVQAGALDLCELHDYSIPAAALPSGPDSMASDLTACHALGKPIFVGEAGIPANVQPDGTTGSALITNASIAQRAHFFQAKIDAFNAAGGVGYVIWFKSPFYTLAENNLDVPNGDPTEAVLKDALMPESGPPTATPELPWPAGAVAVTAVGAGAVLRLRRRGRARKMDAQAPRAR